MSDDDRLASPTNEATHREAPLDSTRFLSPDWVLQDLVRIVNTVEIGDFVTGITLTTSGLVISGILIGLQEYFQEYGRWWRKAFSDDAAGQETETHWSAIGHEGFTQAKAQPTNQFEFIHLKDAQVLGGFSAVPSQGGMLWRGRLAHVSGFALLKMSAKPTTFKLTVPTPQR